MLSPADALDFAQQWSTTRSVGDSPTPIVTVDLRGLTRSIRRDDVDQRLVEALDARPWVNIAVVDGDLDPALAPFAERFDVVVGENTDLDGVVDVPEVSEAIAELQKAITASPDASVALAQLLRLTHDQSVRRALHAESLTYAVLQTGATFRAWLASRKPAPPPEADEVAVGVSRTGSLLRITLQRPHRRNALNVAMRDQLCEVLDVLDLDASLDGAILSGAGTNFCAGGDLDEFGSTPSPAIGHRVRSLQSLPALFDRLAPRLRVHVHGSCVGAGIELPAFTHSIIAHPNATFRLPEIGFGLVPGAGGTVSVTRRCGRHRSAWLALTGRTIDAEQALSWNLIDRLEEFEPTG